MKKLLVLTLVLGMASLASAGYSIAGYNGEDLRPGDTLVLQIMSEEVAAAEYAYGVLTVDAMGDVVGGAVGAGAGNLGGPAGGTFKDFFPAANGKTAIDWSASDSGGAVLSGVVIDNITFECLGVGPAVLELWVSSDFANFSMADSITISQVPEPATLALLGLGGLLLRRKK